MKKLFSLFVLLLSVLLLASCGGNSGNNGGTDNPVGGGGTEKLFDISGLKGTVEKDEEGNPVTETKTETKKNNARKLKSLRAFYLLFSKLGTFCKVLPRFLKLHRVCFQNRK